MRSSATPEIIKPLEKGFSYLRFYDLNERNGIFSNYHNKTLTIAGREHKTAEHYFQCLKFEEDSDSWQAVFNAATPNDARLFAEREHNKTENKALKDKYYASGPGFDAAKKRHIPYTTVAQLANSEEYKNMVMTVLARAEFDEEYGRMLDESGDSYILEDTYQGPPGARNKPDTKWGGGPDGMGDNLLGLALMEVRAERQAEKNSEVLIQANLRAELFKRREQARRERVALDKLAGGADKTSGKKLTEIAKLATADKPEKDSLSTLTPTPRTPKKGRGLNFIRERKVIEAALRDDGWTAKADTKPHQPVIMQKDTEEFTIHPNKFTTESSKQDTFVAMLKAFKAANPGQEPHVTCDQAEIQTKWQAAMKQVYPGITNPDIKLEDNNPHPRPKM